VTPAKAAAHLDREVDRGALVAVMHSGGKDSQAMYLRLRRRVPARQLVVVHAPLGRVEWSGCMEHIEATVDPGVPVIEAPAVFKDGSPKDLLTMVRRKAAQRQDRPPWPDARNRWCTSELKEGPCNRVVREYADAHGFQRVVCALGIRAQESPRRRQLVAWEACKKRHGTRSRARGWTRAWHRALPIHHLDESEVWGTIAGAGQRAHPVYDEGMTRLSCRFCILASNGDLRTAAELDPELYAEYVELERRTGYTVSMSGKSLPDRTGIVPVAAVARASSRRRSA